MQFAGDASLHETVGGWDSIIGVNNPAKSFFYRLQAQKTGALWLFSFHDDEENQGTLSVTAADRLRRFAVDTKPERQKSGGYVSVDLYKEWEISGPVSGTGIFDVDLSGPTIARLIFHGRGNNCTNSHQFSNWTLDISGPGSNYRFIGRLR